MNTKNLLVAIIGITLLIGAAMAQDAVYSSTYTAPFCSSSASPCVAGSSLLMSKDNWSPAEPNQPNTIDSCTDGTSGSYQSDENTENVTITSLTEPTGYLNPGDSVRVDVTMFCYSTSGFSPSKTNLIYTNSTSNPWRYITQLGCSNAGAFNTLSFTTTLDDVEGNHVFRALSDSNPSSGTTCGTSGYSDNDDVVFYVKYIHINSPTNSTYATDNVWGNITVPASDWCGYSLDGAANVTMSNDTDTHYYSHITGIADGHHNINVYCNDSSGKYFSETQSFTTDAHAPLLTFNKPTNGSRFVPGDSVELYATASDAVQLDDVSLYVNGTLEHSCSSSPCQTFWDTTAYSEGTYNLTSIATDEAGNTNTSFVDIQLMSNEDLVSTLIDESTPDFKVTSSGGTEYEGGEQVNLWLQVTNTTDGSPIDGATCKIDVYNETPLEVVDAASMTSLSNGGLYYYQNTSLSSNEGYYTALFNCSYNGEYGYGTHSFHVAPWANTINELLANQTTIYTYLVDAFNCTTTPNRVCDYLDSINSTSGSLTAEQNQKLNDIYSLSTEINDTTWDTNNYLKNTIYPAVDDLNNMSQDILDNQTTIYNKLVEIQSNVTTTYNEVLVVEALANDIDNNMASNFTDVKNRLDEINSTTWDTYYNITQTVNPKLDAISSKLDTLQSSNNDLEAYLNCSNMQTDSICWRLDLIQNYTDSVEGNLDGINDSIYAFQDINTGRFDNIDNNLTLIYGDTQWLVNNVADNASVHAKLNNLLVYADDINNTVYQTEADLGVMNNTLNSLDNYVRNTLTSYVDDVENMENELLTNQTLIYNKVVEVQNNVTNTYNLVADARADIATLSSDMDSNFTALSAQINNNVTDLQSRIGEVNQTTRSILSNITAVVEPKLDQILDNTTTLYDAIDDVKSELNCDTVNPTDLCYRVATIQGYTDNVESYVLSVNNTLNNYQTIDIGRFDDIDGNLTNIYNDTQYIRDNLATNDSLNASLTRIEELTTEINDTTHSIRSDLTGMNTTLVGVYNNTVGAVIPYVTTVRPWWFGGETMDIRAQFHSLTGNLINPTSVNVEISSDADVVYSSGNMTNDGIGEYYYKYVIPKYQTGIYRIRVSAIYGDVNTSRTILTRVFSQNGAFTTYCEAGHGGSEGHYSSEGYTETSVGSSKSLEKPKISVGTGLTTAKQPTDVTVTGMVLFGLLSVGTLWLFIKK